MQHHSSPLRAVKSVGLSAEEKDEVRSHLASFMRAHPLRSAEQVSVWDVRFLLFPLRTMSALALVVLMLAGAGGVSAYAAESALPGEALYPIKVYFSEPLRTALILGAGAKVRVEAEHAERRLEEAAVLASQGNLNDGARAQLSELFDEQFERARKGLSTLAETDDPEAADISARIEGTLTAHAAVLKELSGDEQSKLESLIESVEEAKKAASNDRVIRAKVGVAVEQSDQALEFARQEMDRLGGELKKRALRSGEETAAKVQRRIDAAHNAVFRIKVNAEGGNTPQVMQNTQASSAESTSHSQGVKVDVRVENGVPSVIINGVSQSLSASSSPAVTSSSSVQSASASSSAGVSSTGSTSQQVESHVEIHTSTTTEGSTSIEVHNGNTVEVHMGN